MLCYCCSKKPFSACCEPFIKEDELPKHPEQLMRSRFSAYASKSFQYVVNTYDKKSRENISVDDIASDAASTQWVKLEIYNSSVDNEALGYVEFSAFYVVKDQLFEMREQSRFILEDDKWFYTDGEIKKNSKLAKLKRNDPCPCGSGKKYKVCCQLKC